MENGREKEIDLLLRAFARRAKAPTSERGTESPLEPVTAHLDADELIAFAEHALPAAARARYTAHLADCDHCRKILAGLGVESPVQDVRSSKAALPASPGLIEKLLSALRFPAVRYGLPVAVVLVIVTTVLLTAIRSDRRGDVAIIEKQTTTSAPQLKEQSADQSAGSASSAAIQNDTAKSVVPNTESSPVGKPTISTAQSSAGPETITATKEEPKQTQPADVASSELREQQGNRGISSNSGLDKNEEAKTGALSARSEPAAPPPPPATAPLAKPAPEKRPSNEEVVITRDAARGGVGGARKDADQPLLAQSRARAPSAGARPNLAGEDDEKAVDKLSTGTERAKRLESRTVGGKQFRRVNGEWIDSTFNGSDTVNVKRGSEQYRALLADEPGLRPYAEQLSGKVTVVWKGRAYRFH
jgi:hypothetical protein